MRGKLHIADQQSALTKESAVKEAAKELANTTQKKLTREKAEKDAAKETAKELAKETQHKLTKEKAEKDAAKELVNTTQKKLKKEKADKEVLYQEQQKVYDQKTLCYATQNKICPIHYDLID